MSLAVDGFWKAGFWATTFWADGFWREGVPVPEAVTGGTSNRLRRRRKLERRNPEEERLAWLGIRPATVPLPEVLPQLLPGVEPQIRPIVADVRTFTALRLGVSAKVSTATEHTASTRLAMRANAKASLETTQRSRPITFTMVVDKTKVVSEITSRGGGGFRFGSRHNVEKDLWLERQVTDDEANAVLEKLEP